jgi:hypothetical protein
LVQELHGLLDGNIHYCRVQDLLAERLEHRTVGRVHPDLEPIAAHRPAAVVIPAAGVEPTRRCP